MFRCRSLAVSAGPGCPFAGHGASFSPSTVPDVPAAAERPCSAHIARGRARVSAPARFARLIARMRLCARRRRPTPPGCHEMSCFAMQPCGNVMVRRCRLRLQRACAARTSAAGIAASAGAGVGCSHLVSLSHRERRVPLPRAFRARARPRVGAGAVRAPDCARETEGAPLPCVSQGVFEHGAARPWRRRRNGSGCRFSGSYISIISPMSSIF